MMPMGQQLCACLFGERCEEREEMEGRTTKAGNERSSEHELMIAEVEVWGRVGSKTVQELIGHGQRKCKNGWP